MVVALKVEAVAGQSPTLLTDTVNDDFEAGDLVYYGDRVAPADVVDGDALPGAAATITRMGASAWRARLRLHVTESGEPVAGRSIHERYSGFPHGAGDEVVVGANSFAETFGLFPSRTRCIWDGQHAGVPIR